MNTIEENVVVSDLAKVTNSELKFYSRMKDNSEIHSSILGEYSYISQYSIVNKSTIGKFCSIANGCYIGLWEHDTAVSTHSFYLYEHSGHFVNGYKNYQKDCVETHIGHDVWVGANAVIMKGVNVSDGAIIGASAVVTKDVPPYAIVVGNPARIIKYRFSKEDISWLLELRWWNFSRDKIKDIISKDAFSDFSMFKKILKK
jgi:acetyltransferase-like isoleucine patch superfamily enzyme